MDVCGAIIPFPCFWWKSARVSMLESPTPNATTSALGQDVSFDRWSCVLGFHVFLRCKPMPQSASANAGSPLAQRLRHRQPCTSRRSWQGLVDLWRVKNKQLARDAVNSLRETSVLQKVERPEPPAGAAFEPSSHVRSACCRQVRQARMRQQFLLRRISPSPASSSSAAA